MIKSALTYDAKESLATLYKYITCFYLCFMLSACGFQHYVAKPIDTNAISTKIEYKNPESAEFQQFLISNGYSPDVLPLQRWGVDELTFCALFFHPSLEVARAQWRAVAATQQATTQKPNPTLNTHLAHSSNANDDISPYMLGLSIDIPIETAGKRDIRIENASHLSQVAKLGLAQTAWQLRSQVAQSFNEYQFNQQQTTLLSKELEYRQQLLDIYQKRLQLGEASNIELSTAALQFQTNSAELNASQQSLLVARSKLASNLGLPLSQVNAMPLLQDSSNTPLDDLIHLQQKDADTTALLNRLDIRIALEQYAVAETKLKLEIAKQYPDITISPGYAYEFGNNIWSLGLSGLLTLLNKNKLAINAATQLREVEAAQFEALQSKVMSEASMANARLNQAEQIFLQQKKQHSQQQQYTQQMERRLLAGEIDRLALTFVRLEELATEKNVARAYFQLKTAITEMENVLQKPLSTKITKERLEAFL